MIVMRCWVVARIAPLTGRARRSRARFRSEHRCGVGGRRPRRAPTSVSSFGSARRTCAAARPTARRSSGSSRGRAGRGPPGRPRRSPGRVLESVWRAEAEEHRDAEGVEVRDQTVRSSGLTISSIVRDPERSAASPAARSPPRPCTRRSSRRPSCDRLPRPAPPGSAQDRQVALLHLREAAIRPAVGRHRMPGDPAAAGELVEVDAGIDLAIERVDLYTTTPRARRGRLRSRSTAGPPTSETASGSATKARANELAAHGFNFLRQKVQFVVGLQPPSRSAALTDNSDELKGSRSVRYIAPKRRSGARRDRDARMARLP